MTNDSKIVHQDTVEEVAELRSFGRRRGRAMSPRQKQLMADALPGLSLDLTAPAPENLAELFSPPIREVWLEIGFGGSEHLIWQAENNPDVGLIGCEPFEDGVVKAVSSIEQNALGNVRLHADDARDVLRWLPEASIDRAFILFPDPWPKKRHVRRRLVNAKLFEAMGRVMKPGAQLRIGTDIGDYLRTMLIAFQHQSAFKWPCAGPQEWRRRPADWPQTRYEQKAVREGRRSYYLSFVRDEARLA
ncbi:MAG: tRNA (guanosine(46)-N7)-methyltransferase TrmB [Alphaproteobacteria bacterium]|nr:tRNA (guanosine(46)-N7)-methyltransferase TrmB [Alphaproteobacteria bacterium]